MFYYIRIDPISEEYTIFRIRYKVYKYKILPFGLINSSIIYQQYLNNILFNYLNVFYIAYLDDILIYSNNIEEYKKHIKLILAYFKDISFQTDLKKYEFSIIYTKYLEFIIFIDRIEI